ncbi:CGNR zinc finger domain-containing protein [Chitinophaga sp. 22321]|uniref:CGNR zinc finger domain-containing protein n=1 Tax=Chitinophaga hostae TaxID=2831022 RepID=A0ABS5J3A0_9BACT|nr:CGNR zinc finger domain-containing protein [Chitinophaga hostae]MBS0029684.1 CGNR zinc finger domain-containing protein [Chitinophaga hostae]
MSAPKSIATLRLDGGVLCLDFINTIDNRKKISTCDYLNNFKELLQWYAHTGALSPKIIHTLERLAKDYPQKAAIVFEKSIVLRELLHRLFAAFMSGKNPVATDLVQFNSYIGEAYANIEMAWQAGTGKLHFNAPALEQVYWWLVKSAAELYTSASPAQIKECPACGWIFMDKSRNGSRKWCSMSTCGDVDKVTRNYQRTKRKKP